jgi:hypothetical protein
MEPVIAALVFVFEHAELGELPGHAFPVPFARRQQIRRTAEQIELGPVEEDLVEVVDPVAGGQPVVVAEPAVVVGEVELEPAPGHVQQPEQVPLRQSPARRFEQGNRGGDRRMHRSLLL